MTSGISPISRSTSPKPFVNGICKRMRKPEAGPQFRTYGTRYYSDRIRGCRSASRSVYKANWVRLERQLRDDHFPGIAFHAVAIFRLQCLAAPSHDGQYRGRPAPCSGRGAEALGQAPHHRAFPVQQFPAFGVHNARLQGVARRQRGDGTMRRMTGALPSSTATWSNSRPLARCAVSSNSPR